MCFQFLICVLCTCHFIGLLCHINMTRNLFCQSVISCMEENIFRCIKVYFTFMSKSTPMTSVKEKMKSDFLHREQKYIFLDTTGHAYFPDTIRRSHFTFIIVM